MTEDPRLTAAVCRDIAGRQKYLGGPSAIADVLSQLMARRGYARLQASTELLDVWRTAVGPILAEASLPGQLRRGVLEVIVGNSAVMQELGFVKRKILLELARLAPDQKIRDVRFRIGSL